MDRQGAQAKGLSVSKWLTAHTHIHTHTCMHACTHTTHTYTLV